MVITKREDVTKQGLCKILLLALIQFFWVGGGRTVGAYLSLSGRGVGAYSRLGAYYLFRPSGWALIREVGANSRLGTYSNKYGICTSAHLSWWAILWLYAEKTRQEPERKDSVCKQSRDSEPCDWRVCLSICSVFPVRTVLKSQQCLHNILPDETKSAFYTSR